MRARDLFIVFVSFAGIGLGVLAPDQGGLVTPFSAYALMALLFLSFLGIDFRSLLRLQRAGLVEVAFWTAAKLVLMPLAFWALARWLAPAWALPVLLVSGTSIGFLAPFFASFLGAATTRVLLVVVATSLLVPLTLPALVKIILGQELTIPFSHMARLLGMIIFLPLAVLVLARRIAPGLLAALARRAYPLNAAFIFICNLGVFAQYSAFLRSQGRQILIALGLACALALLSPVLGWAGAALSGRRLDALTGAICLTFINNMLVIVFAAEFFGPQAALLAAAHVPPFFAMILPLRWARDRLKSPA